MCAPLGASEGRMICKDCIEAAECNATIKRQCEELDTPRPENSIPHPENCGCPCQHKPVGSWKGDK